MSAPSRMTAIGIAKPGAGVLVRRTAFRPGHCEVLVKVAAAGQPAESCSAGLYRRAGRPDIPGLEIAGEVVALGAGARAGTQGTGDRGFGRRLRRIAPCTSATPCRSIAP